MNILISCDNYHTAFIVSTLIWVLYELNLQFISIRPAYIYIWMHKCIEGFYIVCVKLIPCRNISGLFSRFQAIFNSH